MNTPIKIVGKITLSDERKVKPLYLCASCKKGFPLKDFPQNHNVCWGCLTVESELANPMAEI